MAKHSPTEASLFTLSSLFPEPPKVPRNVSKPDERAIAEGLLREWYESRMPRPRLANYVGARKVIEKFIGDWSEDQLRHALASCNCISIAWLENALRRLYPPLCVVREVTRQEIPDFARPSDVDFGY